MVQNKINAKRDVKLIILLKVQDNEFVLVSILGVQLKEMLVINCYC